MTEEEDPTGPDFVAMNHRRRDRLVAWLWRFIQAVGYGFTLLGYGVAGLNPQGVTDLDLPRPSAVRLVPRPRRSSSGPEKASEARPRPGFWPGRRTEG